MQRGSAARITGTKLWWLVLQDQSWGGAEGGRRQVPGPAPHPGPAPTVHLWVPGSPVPRSLPQRLLSPRVDGNTPGR